MLLFFFFILLPCMVNKRRFSIGAHFHPTPQPPPVPSNWGRKRIYVLHGLWQQFQPMRRPACSGHRRPPAYSSRHWRRRVQATAVRRSHSSCYYYYYCYYCYYLTRGSTDFKPNMTVFFIKVQIIFTEAISGSQVRGN